MEGIPLTNSNHSNYQAVPQEPLCGRDEKKRIYKEIKHLKRVESCQKGCVKAASLILCPLSLTCCTVCCVCSAVFDKCRFLEFCCERQDANHVPYCEWTTCEAPCWHRALPPEDCYDLAKLGFDPLAYFPCCQPEKNSGYYMTGPQRQKMEGLKKRIAHVEADRATTIDEILGFPKVLTELILKKEAEMPSEENIRANSQKIVRAPRTPPQPRSESRIMWVGPH